MIVILLIFSTLYPSYSFAGKIQIDEYSIAASNGDVNAQRELGWIYLNGAFGVEVDFTKAFSWYLKAAKQGDDESQYKVGLMYFVGKGVEKDAGKSEYWLKKSSLQGYADAQYKLGTMYFNGDGVARNKGASALWFEAAKNNGNKYAPYYMGILYEDGEVLKKDLDLSKAMYLISAEAGIAQAMHRVAILCERSGDYQCALNWYKLAMDKRYLPSINNLAGMYSSGMGAKKDISKALALYREASNSGHFASSLNVVSLLIYNDEYRNFEEALSLLTTGVIKGTPESFFLLGELYRHGWGVPKDIDNAKRLYKQACELGDELACASI